MKWDAILRVFGIIGIVSSYAVYKIDPTMGVTALTIVITGIIALVAPEAIDNMPFGPSK